MSYDLVSLREKIDMITKEYGFCPNRIWKVDSQLRDQKSHLSVLLDEFCNGFSGRLKEAMAHEDHSACTFDYCEFSSRNFTNVKQYHEPMFSEKDDADKIQETHKDKSICFPLSGLFREDTLLSGVDAEVPTAWRFDGRTLVEHPRPFMAISHVWSDGTGSGPWGPDHVNECLYVYFKRLAERFQCEGIWWDTLCIPQDKLGRGKALKTMHLNYQNARVTLVHDRFLRKLPFIEPKMACLAIVLSSWFTRGWTALELAKSQKVKIVFKDAIMDLDEDILRKAEGNTAAAVIASLRSNEIAGIEDILRTLGPRYTSWPADRAVIAGLLTSSDTVQAKNGETFGRDIYQRILLRIKKISHGHLFHTSATMSDGFSWFPTSLFQLPQSAAKPDLTINDHGEVVGKWNVVCPSCIRLQDCIWDVSHPLIEAKLRYVLAETRRRHVLLVIPAEKDAVDKPVSRALLVEVFRSGPEPLDFKCQFVGSLRFHSALRHEGKSKEMIVNIGDTRGWQQLDEHENAWNVIVQYQPATDELIRAPQPDRSDVPSGGGWTTCHQDAWVGDWTSAEDEVDLVSWDQPDMLGRCPIHLAAERGHHHIVATLLEKGIDPNRRDGNGQTPLHRAAWGGSLTTVELLLDKGSDATAQDKFGNSALHVAADVGFAHVVRCLCKRNNVSAKGRNGLRPLHYAAMSGHRAIVEYLLQNGANVEAVDDVFGWTALHCAAETGHRKIVSLLLRYKAIVDATDDKVKWTPLHLATMNGNGQVANMLHCNMNTQRMQDKDGWTPLHFDDLRWNRTRAMRDMSDVSWTLLHLLAIDGRHKITRLMLDTEQGTSITEETIPAHVLHEAAKRGYYRAAKILVERGALVVEALENYKLPIPTLFDNGREYKELFGTFTPLHLAARYGHSKTAWVLIEEGANVDDEVDGENAWSGRYTALHLAAMSGNPTTVSSLTQQRARLDIRTVLGYTALSLAAMNGHKDVVEKLLEERASIDAVSGGGYSALGCAVRGGYEDVVDKILERHPPVDARSNALGAVFEAATKGYVDIFNKLVRHGAPIEAEINGHTPLMLAAKHGHKNIVEILIGKHADVNAAVPDDLHGITGLHMREYRGFSALHLAVEGGHEAVMEMLLAAGAYVDSRNFKGRTPLHLAAKGGHEDIVRKLLQKGAAIDAKDEHEETPLHLAAGTAVHSNVMKFLGQAEMEAEASDPRFARTTEVLLQHGADPNAKSRASRTALHLAAEAGRGEVVAKLIEGHASADIKDKDGNTPRGRAQFAGHEIIAETLKHHEKKGLFERLRR